MPAREEQIDLPDDVQGVLMVDRYSGYKAMPQVNTNTDGMSQTLTCERFPVSFVRLSRCS